MIGSISGTMTSGVQMRPPPCNEKKLTDDQREKVTETMSQFDPDNLTEEDALAIVAAIEELGIEPGRDLAELMSDSGFDAKSVGDAAGVEGPQGGRGKPPPDMPMGTLNASDDTLDDLNQLLDVYLSESSSAEEKESALSAMQVIFEETAPAGGLVNSYA